MPLPGGWDYRMSLLPRHRGWPQGRDDGGTDGQDHQECHPGATTGRVLDALLEEAERWRMRRG